MTSLVTSEGTFNQTVYDEYGPLYLGAQMLWGIFFSYAAYTSAWVWAILFGYPSIVASIKKIRERNKAKNGKSINFQYTDQLNILQRSYKEVPIWWYVVLFACSFVSIIVMVACGQLYIPIWTYFVAILTGAAVVTVRNTSEKEHSKLTDFALASWLVVRNIQLPTCKYLLMLDGCMS